MFEYLGEIPKMEKDCNTYTYRVLVLLSSKLARTNIYCHKILLVLAIVDVAA